MKLIKSTALALAIGLLAFNATAQSVTMAGSPASSGDNHVYLGVGTGINSPSGFLGLRFDGQVSDKLVLGVGAGLSTWGYKVSFNAQLKTPSNWCPMLSFAHNTGATNVPLEIQEEVGATVVSKTVNFDLDGLNSLSFGVEKQWFTPRGNRLGLTLGYAILVTSGGYYRTVNPAEANSYDRQATDLAFRIVAPGGIIVGFNYCFKLK